MLAKIIAKKRYLIHLYMRMLYIAVKIKFLGVTFYLKSLQKSTAIGCLIDALQ